MQAKKEAEQKHSQGNAALRRGSPSVPIAVSRADIAYSIARVDIVLIRRMTEVLAKQDLADG